jgi:type IV pilus assembly protein PilV
MYQRFQNGLSMIEILVTLTIVAFGVLGLLGLQARALSFQKDSFDRKSAAEMVSEFAERARVNYQGFRNGFYNRDLTPSAGAPAIAACGPCDEAETADRDLREWHTELRRRIPGAGAYVRWDPANDTWIDVTIAWPEPQRSLLDPVDPLCDAVDTAIPKNFRCYRVRVLP